MKPSDFAALGIPTMSTWFKYEMETLAWCVVLALRVDGDAFRGTTIIPARAVQIWEGILANDEISYVGRSILADAIFLARQVDPERPTSPAAMHWHRVADQCSTEEGCKEVWRIK